MSVYKVIGRRFYNDQPPGSVFHATLDKAAEQRAVDRGAIQILDSRPPGLVPGTYRPPVGWDTTSNPRSPRNGASTLRGAK